MYSYIACFCNSNQIYYVFFLFYLVICQPCVLFVWSVVIPAGIRYPPDTRWVRARVQNPTCGYSHGRVWVMPAGIVAGGYLPYPIRTRPIAIPSRRLSGCFGHHIQQWRHHAIQLIIYLKPNLPRKSLLTGHEFLCAGTMVIADVVWVSSNKMYVEE
jgi:hypothetical protein